MPRLESPTQVLIRAQQSMDAVASYRFDGQVESITDGELSLGEQSGAWSSEGARSERFDGSGSFNEAIVVGSRFFFRASGQRDGAWVEAVAEGEAATESVVKAFLLPPSSAELELLPTSDVDAPDAYLLRWRLVSNVTPPLPVETESTITRTETVDLLVDGASFRVLRVFSDAVMRIESVPPDGGDPELEDEFVLRLEYNLSDFDEPVQIEPPI